MKSNLISVGSKLLLLLAFVFSIPVFAQDDTLSTDSLETPLESPFESYFSPLSYSDAQDNYNQINTSATYESYTSVPSPKSATSDDWVSNPDGMLSQSAVDTINAICNMLEAETGFELAVACLNSIGDNDPHTYATDLFNHWGIGKEGADNGLLIVVVNDVHKVSTITGRGTEAYITDIETDNVHQNEMIPYFRDNDYVTGVIRGVQAYVDMIYGFPPDYYSYESDSYDYNYDEDYSETYINRKPWYQRTLMRYYLLLIGVFSGMFFLFMIISFTVRDLHKRYHFLKFFTLLIWPILMPIPFIGLYFLARYFMDKWRNTERFSHDAGLFMVKLDEKEDDKYLKGGQVKEEVLTSIDYDVWITPNEENPEVLILPYKRWFSKFRKCPKCKFKTYNKDYDRVISAATYTSSGTGERKYSCKNCSHSKITRYTIPRKVKSSSGGYSGGSSYGGSSGGSSYGGGGGSFGGGSSRGGGSTSGW